MNRVINQRAMQILNLNIYHTSAEKIHSENKCKVLSTHAYHLTLPRQK